MDVLQWTFANIVERGEENVSRKYRLTFSWVCLFTHLRHFLCLFPAFKLHSTEYIP